jgi:CMP-N,N'-diacetyllegionaminic acid synthase
MIITIIIPARYGSKGIPLKNIKSYLGEPLIAHSIKLAIKLKDECLVDNIILSTDSEEFRKIGIKYGASVPFLRPKEISGDHALDYEFLEHYLKWENENITDSNKHSNLLLQLRPTSPNRSIDDVRNCIKLMSSDNNYNKYDSLRSVIKVEKNPYKMYEVDTNKNQLVPLFNEYNGMKEPYNSVRQLLPTIYLHNGYIDIIKRETILNKKSVTGDMILPYIMRDNENEDIDYEKDWK